MNDQAKFRTKQPIRRPPGGKIAKDLSAAAVRLLDAVRDGAALAGPDGTILHANAALDARAGRRRGELVGVHLTALCGEAVDFDVVEAAIDATGCWQGRLHGPHPDGTICDMEIRITAEDVDGRRLLFMVERRESVEQAASRAETETRTRLDQATAAAGIGVWDWNVVTGELICSAQTRAILGFPATGPLTPAMIRKAIDPADRQNLAAMIRRALDPAVRERQPYELRMTRADGRAVRVLAYAVAVFEPVDGTVRAVRYAGTVQDITELRATEQQLASSTGRLRIALEAGRMATWGLDLKTDRLVGSPRLHRVLGFPAGYEPTLDELRAGYLPGERERIRRHGIAALEAGERTFEVEFRYRQPNGTLIWLLLRAEVMFEAGLPSFVAGVVMDVTERRDAEERLRSSEERLRALVESTPHLIWAADADGRGTYFSPQWLACTGMPAERQYGDGWLDAVHPADRDRLVGNWRAAVAEGRPYESEHRMRGPGGSYRWFVARGMPVRDQAGRVREWFGASTDITDLVDAREALKGEVAESNSDRRLLFELSPDLFAVADLHGRLRRVNPAWTTILGLEEMSLIGTGMIDLVHPDDRAEAIRTLAALSESSLVRRCDIRLRGGEGSYRWIAWTAVPDGDSIYAIGRDVTDERQRAVTLLQAQKMEAVGQLTGGIAHDFNNLLMAISAGLDLAEKTTNPERLRRIREGVRQAVDRGAGLTRQLLAFARRQMLRPQPIDVAAQLEGMREILERSLRGDIGVSMAFPDDLWPVEVDPGQLELAVLNIAVNARDAMPNGGRIEIRAVNAMLTTAGEPAAFVDLIITDNGNGIAADVIGRVFEPFFTTKEPGRGTGLGLSQVYGFARQSGGDVRLDSAPGSGTSVHLVLPRSGGVPEVRKASPAEVAVATPRRGRLLLVEDDENLATLGVQMAEELGFTVLTADSAVAALRLLESGEKVDILFSDVVMPGALDGLDLAREARLRWPGLPVLLATGYTASHEEMARDRIPLLRKPYRMAELADAVDRLLR